MHEKAKKTLKALKNRRHLHKPKNGPEIYIDEMGNNHLIKTMKRCVMVNSDSGEITRYTSRGHLYLNEMKKRGLDTTDFKIGNTPQSEPEYVDYNHLDEINSLNGDWGGLYGEEAEAGYWNTH